MRQGNVKSIKEGTVKQATFLATKEFETKMDVFKMLHQNVILFI